MDIDTALNGKLAYDKVLEADAAKCPFQLIFMDINMPEMDGIESSRLITRSCNDKRISTKPFIAAITAYTTPYFKQQALSNGMDRFLTKPADAQRVYEIVQNVLDNSYTNTGNISQN